jgi:hypothetical protein
MRNVPLGQSITGFDQFCFSPPSGSNVKVLLMRLTPSDTVDLIDLIKRFDDRLLRNRERIRRSLPRQALTRILLWEHFRLFSTEPTQSSPQLGQADSIPNVS